MALSASSPADPGYLDPAAVAWPVLTHPGSSDAARDAVSFVASPPVTRELLPYQVPLRVFASAAVALVPRDLRRLAGIDRPAAADLAALAMARPWLDVMRTPAGRAVSALVIGGHSRTLRQGIERHWGKVDLPATRARRAEQGITGPGISAGPSTLRAAA